MLPRSRLWIVPWTTCSCDTWVSDVRDLASNLVNPVSTSTWVLLWLLNWTYWGRKCNFECCKRVVGRNVFACWHIFEMYALPGTVHTTLYLGCPPWLAAYKLSRVKRVCLTGLLVLFELVTSSAARAGSRLDHRGHPICRLVAFWFLDSWCNATIGLTCHGGVLCRIGRIMAPLVLNLTSVAMWSGFLCSWRGYHLILWVWLLPAQVSLRWTGRASVPWMLGFHIVWNW